MPDDTARLRGLLASANERGLSIPGDPAWPIEQARYEGRQKALREMAVEALPALLDRIEALEAGLRWQPIESAPRDGSYMLIATESHDGGMTVARFDPEWGDDGWWMLDDGKNFEIPLRGPEPTHWMPRPAPPARALLEGERG